MHVLQKKRTFALTMTTFIKNYTYSFILFLLILNSSCGDTYQKVMKSSDYTLKSTKVKEYYNKGDYEKATPLFEELIPIVKGTKDAEKLYYFYCYAQYGNGDYLFANHYFKNFLQNYPKSVYAEDAQFMSAFSLYKLAPRETLDQSNTEKAIENMQLFINNYPQSSKIEQANQVIDDLRSRLETKAFESAKLYFRLHSYKAAATSFKNLLSTFPDTKRQEEIMFYILKSYFLLAQNSIETKKQERYTLTIDSYYAFIDKYPQSKYLRDAEKIFSSSQQYVAQNTKNN